MEMSLIRERFLKDGIPVRLGGIAANMARIKSFSDHTGHGEAIRGIIRESKFLTEWCAPAANLEVQTELAQLQVQLALWERTWDQIWTSPPRRAGTAEAAGKWSQKLLALAGFLP